MWQVSRVENDIRVSRRRRCDPEGFRGASKSKAMQFVAQGIPGNLKQMRRSDRRPMTTEVEVKPCRSQDRVCYCSSRVNSRGSRLCVVVDLKEESWRGSKSALVQRNPDCNACVSEASEVIECAGCRSSTPCVQSLLAVWQSGSLHSRAGDSA